ncbi:CHC2 zinc finger domain-containing protein [Caulobacter sp. Root487D2Y]|uniref:CHC2 zinc finger domain-containing protein n=1 Tax=Caulobacter sp. Root487D2Y TaxID=1736547 RepID=UPI0009E92DDD|nr:CHC2 zinc finger domain-containing protein [Caulobacter sp. Root487D2Y]
MARIPDSEIERLKVESDLVGIVAASGVKLEKRGADHVGRCPFHDDKTPSLVISPDKNLWRCFGACDVGGDPIAWVMRREAVSFRHAVELLKGDYAPSGEAPAKTRSTVAKLAPLATPAEDAALLGEVAGFYHAALKTTPEALAYLERRGLTHPDLIDTFGLGYADRTLGYRLPQANRKAGAEVRGRLQALGVLRESGHEHLRGSLVVPTHAVDAATGGGTVANLYGRKIRGDLRAGTAEHLYLPGPHRGVFNRAGIMGADEVILAEALIDALTFWCAGHRHVTSAYGAGGFTDEILAALVEAGVKRVLIAFDRDAAGDKGAVAVAERLAAAGIGAYRVNFPKGMDANAYALAVTPAGASLGALLRSAEWMAGGTARHVVIDEDGVILGEPVEAAPGPDLLLAAKMEVADQPSHAGPIPPGPSPAIEALVGERDVTIALGDRAWRVRGLERNVSLEALKINLLVRRGQAFHVDSLDLLSARSRGSFAAEAAAEIDMAPEAVKRDLGQILLKLEAMQEERALATKAETSGPAAPVLTPERETAALALLRSPNLLDQIAADVAASGVVGEACNALVAYLAVISRKLEKPLAVLIQSTSAAGKSALMDAVRALAPPEETVAYSAMTGQSLFYLGQGDLKHKALAIAEEEGARHASYALKLLQSQGTLTIASTGKDPASGKLVTQTYTVEGPVALMMTTTAIDLDEELKNRCLVLTIDESREQTRAIQDRQRFEETLEGLAAGEDRAAIVALHQDAQRLLRPLKVVNPYAEQLTFLDDKTRTRRDHRKYLGLIRAIALLHQHQRPIRQLVRPGREVVDYVEATLNDIAAANHLAHAVLGVTLDELPPQTRRLLGLVRQMVEARAQAAGIKPQEVRFTRREVREATGWGDTQAKVHLGRLEELEYLLLRRDAGRFVYELAWAREGEAGEPFVMGLIDIEALKAPSQARNREYDDNRAGLEGQRAALGRGAVGVVSAPGRPGEILAKPSVVRLAVQDDADEAAQAHPGAANGAGSYTYPQAVAGRA